MYFLGYNAVQSGENQPLLGRNMPLPSSWSKDKPRNQREAGGKESLSVDSRIVERIDQLPPHRRTLCRI
jgi:hypothetical protein